MNQEFLSRINCGDLRPVILSSGDSSTFDANCIVVNVPDNRKKDCWEYVRRFNPQATPRRLVDIYKETLHETGFPNGTVGYFPIGTTIDHEVVWEKFNYFSKPFHQKLMAASSWKLVPETAREGLKKITYYGIGLSVGSALAEVATRLGVDTFVLGDSDTADSVGQERQAWSNPRFLGWNKTAIAEHQIVRRNPYAQVTAFHRGLRPENASDFFADIINTARIHFIVEETDSALAKNLARSAPRDILTNLELKSEVFWVMMADVGTTETVVTTDQLDGLPYDGRVARLDLQGDPYGKNLTNLQMLFAAMGGVEAIPQTSNLLAIVAQGLIGREIRNVPQAYGSVLQAQAVMYEVLMRIASGEGNKLPASCSISLKSLL